MANRKLVAVGNRMAGARGVEEMLSPGGERFGIVMLGAEPMATTTASCSRVLSGARDTSESPIP
jgi:nitrite reductase (NADH) large subunit